MKKFLASLLAAAAFTSPVLAEDKVKSWRSFDSVGCMMLRECTKDVRQAKTWMSFGEQHEANKDEITDILTSLNQIGVNVYIGDDKYFAFNTRGLYYVKGNDMFFNEKYISSPTMLIKVLRHEGWHTAQDCMAGTLDNTFTAIILQPDEIPDWIKDGAKRTYPPSASPYESEAMFAAFSDTMTRDALKVCAGPKRMWEVYKPTPLTEKWLMEQGYISK